MRLIKLAATTAFLVQLGLGHAGVQPIDVSADPVSILAQLQDQVTQILANENNVPRSKIPACNLATASQRKGWEKLTTPERKDFIRAVKCLMANEPKLDLSPAARSRHDEFVALHSILTPTIHRTGNFFTWHRYYLWAYEQALRDECGYEGYLPYWNWFSRPGDLYNSPIFDGSDTSLSGDGEFFAHNGTLVGGKTVWLPSGNGGGCLKSGPFKDTIINIGPISPGMVGMVPLMNSSDDYNPRCIRRDLNVRVAETFFTTPSLLNVTIGNASATIKDFQNEILGRYPDGFIGLHSAGHTTLGADGGDINTSPNDPAFFLHHAMLDRIFWIWQVLHPDEARKLYGTITLGNNPPSRNATIDDPLEMLGVVADRPIREVFGTLDDSPLCYIYL